MRAPGVKQTLLPMQSSAVKIGSMCTVPVKVSVGCFEAVSGLCEARINCILMGLISIGLVVYNSSGFEDIRRTNQRNEICDTGVFAWAMAGSDMIRS